MSGTMHEQLQDRMPEVARGRATWDAEDLAHLASCAECREEWLVVQGAAAVGARVEREFDATGAAQAVTARLRREGRSKRRPLARTLVGLAAAAAVAFAYLGPRAADSADPGPLTEARLFPELDSLSTEELTIVADGLGTPLAETPLGVPHSLDELDSAQLTRVLHALEG